MLAQTPEQLQKTFEELVKTIPVPSIKNGTEDAVWTYLMFQVGPDMADAIMKMFSAFFQRGYDEAKLELMRKGMML